MDSLTVDMAERGVRIYGTDGGVMLPKVTLSAVVEFITKKTYCPIV